MKTLLRFSALAILLIIFTSSVGWGETYYSQGNLAPNLTTSWKNTRDASGTNPSSWNGHTFVIQNGHTMTTTGNWTIGVTVPPPAKTSNLTIESGGTLIAAHTVTFGRNLGTFTIQSTGTYYHQNTSPYNSTIFFCNKNFDNGSNFIINKTATGLTSAVTFGNLTIELTEDPGNDVNFGAYIAAINGNFELKNSQGRKIIFSQSTTYPLSVGGDFKISGGELDFSNGLNTPDKFFTLNLSNNFIQTGGIFTHSNTTPGSELLINFLNNGKSFTQSAGTFTNTYMNWSVTATSGTFTFNDNFTIPQGRYLTVNSGTVSISSGKTITSNGVLEFKNDNIYGQSIMNGDGLFTLGSTGKIITANPDGINSSGSTGSIQVNGTRSFNNSSSYEYNGTNAQVTGNGYSYCNNITINNSNGVTLSNNLEVNGTLTRTKGAINLNSNTLTYGSEGTLKYNGSGLSTGEEFTSAVSPANLEVSLGADVTLTDYALLAGGAYIYGTLDFGIYMIYGNQRPFQINGTVITANPNGLESNDLIEQYGSIYPFPGGSISYSDGASYVFNGTDPQSTIANFRTCNNLTIDNASGVTLINGSNSNLTVNGTLDLKQGEFLLNERNLTLNGNIAYSGLGTGTITSTNDCGITIGGELGGSLGTLKFTTSYNTIKSLTMIRTGASASASLGTDLIIDGTVDTTMTLYSGNFIITGQTITFHTTNTPIIRNGTSQIGTIEAGSGSTILFGTDVAQGGSSFTIPAGTFYNSEVYNLTVNRVNDLLLGSDIIVNNSLTLTSGEFGLNSKSLTLNGTVSRTSGSITGDNDANITIGGTGALGTLVFTTGSEYLGTMTINRTSSGTVTLGNDLTFNGVSDAANKGKLTLTEGTLDVGSGRTLTFINGNTPIARTNGTIDNNVSLVFGTTDNLGGTAFTLPTGTFGVSKSVINLTVNRTNNIIFTDDITINGELTLTAGILDNNTNDKLIILSSSGSLDGTAGNAGLIKGKFKRYIPVSTGTYAFPLTKSTVNQTAIVNFTTQPEHVGSLTAEFITGAAGNLTVQVIPDNGYTLTAYSTTGYWRILAGDELSGGIYNLSLYAYSFAYVSKVDSLRIIKRSNSGNSWGVNGTPGTNSGTNSTAIVNRTTLNEGFSEFAIASNYKDNAFEGPLPVKLQTFTYNVKQNNAMLKWSTSQEINNSGFEIERTNIVDNKFIKIGFVKGNGNTNQEVTYNYTDSKLNAGKYKYRLKQIDFNGNFEYFDLEGNVEVGIPTKYDIGQNYPNPFNPMTKIDFELPENGHVNIMIYDMLGREVKSLMNEMKQAGYYTVELNAGNLSSGTYFYRMTAGKFVKTLKMVVVK